MFVPYNDNCDRDTIEEYLEKQLNDEPSVYLNNRVMLVKKKETYEVHMLVPTGAANRRSGYTRKWRLYFRDNDMFLRERFTVGALFAAFMVMMTSVTAIGAFLTGEYSLSMVTLVCFILFFGIFFVLHPKLIKDFLNEKME